MTGPACDIPLFVGIAVAPPLLASRAGDQSRKEPGESMNTATSLSQRIANVRTGTPDEDDPEIQYHLDEIAAALDPANVHHINPTIRPDDKALDLGGGSGNTYVGMAGLAGRYPGAMRVCMDISAKVIAYGIRRFGRDIQFLVGDGATIPFPDSIFNLVFSRVALPYMNIPRTAAEAHRTLVAGGVFWITPHFRDHAMDGHRKDAVNYLLRADAAGTPRWRTWKPRLKMWLHRTYVLLNGYLFEHTGLLVPYLNGRYESWQSLRSMQTVLQRAGFDFSYEETEHHTVIKGIKR